MDQFTCDKLFNLKNPDNKAFLFAKIIAQKIDMIKHDHMMNAQMLVNSIKLSLEHFNNALVNDTVLSAGNMTSFVSNALNAANNMANNNVNYVDMAILKTNLDGIWQLANTDQNMFMLQDLNMLHGASMQFIGKDCAHTDFQMLANDLSMLHNSGQCPNNDPMNQPYLWDNFVLFDKCQNASEMANVLQQAWDMLNNPMMPPVPPM